MPKTIFFRVGDQGTILLPDLVISLGSFMIYSEISMPLYQKGEVELNWEVTSITKTSPIIIGVTPEPNPGCKISVRPSKRNCSKALLPLLFAENALSKCLILLYKTSNI